MGKAARGVERGAARTRPTPVRAGHTGCSEESDIGTRVAGHRRFASGRAYRALPSNNRDDRSTTYLLVENGLCLTAKTHLFVVITAFALREVRGLTSLVLRHLVRRVLAALLALAVGPALLRDIHHGSAKQRPHAARESISIGPPTDALGQTARNAPPPPHDALPRPYHHPTRLRGWRRREHHPKPFLVMNFFSVRRIGSSCRVMKTKYTTTTCS